MRMRPGDYFYANGDEKHTQQGAWGIVRVLPGRSRTSSRSRNVATPSTTYVLPVQDRWTAPGRGRTRAARARRGR